MTTSTFLLPQQTSTDGQRIYVAEADSGHQAYTLKNGQTITWGS